MSKDIGGPAFPCTPEHSERMDGSGGSGMSIRDYFAASALSGLTAHPNFNPIKQPVQCAKDAYAIADAMLAERAK